jgi:hypothetical protein
MEYFQTPQMLKMIGRVKIIAKKLAYFKNFTYICISIKIER